MSLPFPHTHLNLEPPDPTTLEQTEMFLRQAVGTAFIWLPLVFLAYAIGRKRFRIWFFLAFTTAEAIAIWVAIWLHNGGWELMYQSRLKDLFTIPLLQ